MAVAVLVRSARTHRSQDVNINLTNALGVHPAALELRVQRTLTLANNIAHADTPGYKARDLDFRELLASQAPGTSAVQIRRTNGAHLSSGGSDHQLGQALMYRTPLMPSLDGNTVDLQSEQARFAQNNSELEASMHFLNSRLKGLLTAIKGE